MNRDEEEMMMLMMEDGKIIAKIPAPDTNQKIPTGKYLLDKYSSNVSIRNELLEMGIYICARWIVDLVKVTAEISNIKADLVPQLLKRQFRGRHSTDIPKQNPYSSTMARYCEESTLRNMLVGLPREIEAASDESECMYSSGNPIYDDFIRCYAYTCEFTKKDDDRDCLVCHKLQNFQTYLNLNAFVISQVKGRNMIANSSAVADTATIKQSSIGKDVNVGVETEINNSILMDKAEVGGGCRIQNSVLCEGVKIKANCSINNCVIGRDVVIAQGSKMRGETRSNLDY